MKQAAFKNIHKGQIWKPKPCFLIYAGEKHRMELPFVQMHCCEPVWIQLKIRAMSWECNRSELLASWGGKPSWGHHLSEVAFLSWMSSLWFVVPCRVEQWQTRSILLQWSWTAIYVMKCGYCSSFPISSLVMSNS